MGTDANTISLLQPELFLVVTAVVILVGGAFYRGLLPWVGVALVGVFAAGVAWLQQQGAFQGDAWVSGPLMVDAFAGTMRGTSLVLAGLFCLMLPRGLRGTQSSEALGMVVLLFVGLLTVCWAGNLVLLFLGLELISIPTYVLLFLGRRQRRSAEATAKYFFLSILSSALFLFGLMLISGVAGTAEFAAMRMALADGARLEAAGTLASLGTFLAFAGMGFKIAAVPFHFYAPDVYSATTYGNAGILAVVPKVAGIVALMRLFLILAPLPQGTLPQLAIVASLATMTLGNVCALWQRDIRRMMAYSSIAHAGYLLIGLAVAAATFGDDAGGITGFASTLLYLVVYSVASLGTFAVLSEINGTEDRDRVVLVEDLAGLARSRPWMAAVLAICMFSLAGIPPLAGFWGKLTLLAGAMTLGTDELLPQSGWFLTLAVVGVLNAATAAAYYLRLVGVAYFQDASPEGGGPALELPGLPGLAALICGFLLLVGGLFPGFLVDRFQAAGQSMIVSTELPDDGQVDLQQVSYRAVP